MFLYCCEVVIEVTDRAILVGLVFSIRTVDFSMIKEDKYLIYIYVVLTRDIFIQ